MNTDNLKKEIKKIKVGHVALLCTGVFLAFLIIGSILLAAGGAFSISGGPGLHFGGFMFGPGQTYDVNDHKTLEMAGVNSIVIAAVSDDVTMLSGGDQIVADLVGQCRTAGTPVHLETRMNGGTLTIEVKYPIGSNSSSTRLAVTIPSGYQGSLSIATVSGGIRSEDMPFRLQQVNLNSVSGNIRFGTESFTRLGAGSVSGDVYISGITAGTTVETTSGKVELDYAETADTSVTSISGDVRAYIPGSAAFSVDFGSISGTFRSSHPSLDISKASRGFTSTKEGAPTIRVHTTSGDFRIEGK